jgi:putative ubiquitin-RnfH superfamily antitoxin RatB of RatAB toxin-antitoxin module
MALSIEVCYALPQGQSAICALSLGEGVTVREAIEARGLLARFPEIDLNVQKVGVFGKIRPLDEVLVDRDRVEIYRPLKVDPKVARQRRVEKTRRGGSIEGRRWTRKEAR